MADETVSLDEFLSNRKDFVKPSAKGDILVKGRSQAASTWDPEKRTIQFIMSAEVEDRDRDIVVQAGLLTDEFEKNPQAFYNHNARGFPVGRWSDVRKVNGRPKRTEGTLHVLPEGTDELADRLAAHLNVGSIKACSIGFLPKRIKRRERPDTVKDDEYYWPGYLIEEAELVECSPCTIPSNPAALAKMAKDGDVVASEILELVLDTWAKHPETGMIIPRSEFEAAYKASTGEARSFTISIDKAGMRVVEVKAGKEGREADDPDKRASLPPAPPPVATEPQNEEGKGEKPAKKKEAPVASAGDSEARPDPDPSSVEALTPEQKDGFFVKMFKLLGFKTPADIEKEVQAREAKAAADRDALRKEVQALTESLSAKGLAE